MAVCLGVVVFLLEYFWDWTKDLKSLDVSTVVTLVFRMRMGNKDN